MSQVNSSRCNHYKHTRTKTKALNYTKDTTERINNEMITEQFCDRIKNHVAGNSLVVQWLGHGVFSTKGTGSIPGRRTKIPHAAQIGQT